MNNDMIFSMGIHTYIANIEECDEDTGYIVTFPSLKGCITFGETLEEAITMAKDALAGYLEARKDLGWPIPPEKKFSKRFPKEFSMPVSVSVA